MNFHEGRNELTLEMQDKLQGIIEKKHKDPNYYILIASKPHNIEPGAIDIKYILLKEKDRPKDPIIGTILYYVDNLKNDLKRIWVLPRDIYQPAHTINKAGDYSDEIFHSGMPAGRLKAPNR